MFLSASELSGSAADDKGVIVAGENLPAVKRASATFAQSLPNPPVSNNLTAMASPQSEQRRASNNSLRGASSFNMIRPRFGSMSPGGNSGRAGAGGGLDLEMEEQNKPNETL